MTNCFVLTVLEFKKMKNRTCTFHAYLQGNKKKAMNNPFGLVMTMNRSQRHFMDLKNFLNTVSEPECKQVRP